ncbi:MFS multidrug transporter [Microthyrium microscopicum]|uniref:MFS multidrug transporter n=1 Tax=Microthyrium microscopicum TaxID=703497 RepID=A0A6A6ULT7_9PEZI|nr:MFS multidrug transporter [Microthyrium microscopicum]
MRMLRPLRLIAVFARSVTCRKPPTMGITVEPELSTGNQPPGIDSDEPQWDNPHDPANPFNWPPSKKWALTLTACYVTLIVGLNATAMTTASETINQHFSISDAYFAHSYWPVVSWTVGAALAPMIVLPILEDFGMRIGYITIYVLFIIFVIPQAVARNFATLIVCRFFSGCCGGVLQDVMDGIIADVWPDAVQRSLPVTCYVFCLLVGVTLGPVMGGAVISSLGWRWIFWIQLVIYGVSLPLVLVFMRETRGHVILSKRSKNKEGRHPAHSLGTAKGLKVFLYNNIARPAQLLCTEPVVFFFTLLSALSYGIVFISTQSVTQVYPTLYNWQEYQAGLVQGSIVIGEILGFIICLYQNHIFARAFETDKTTPNPNLPEVRLYLSILGSFIGLAGGLFWYGWTSYSHLHWILPSVGLAIVGCGSVVVMQAIMMYITDAYAKYAGSASAAVCFGENMFAAFLPLASLPMYTNLGFQWASSLLGFVALVLSFAPIVLVWKGREIRRRSPFMSEAAYS